MVRDPESGRLAVNLGAVVELRSRDLALVARLYPLADGGELVEVVVPDELRRGRLADHPGWYHATGDASGRFRVSDGRGRATGDPAADARFVGRARFRDERMVRLALEDATAFRRLLERLAGRGTIRFPSERRGLPPAQGEEGGR